MKPGIRRSLALALVGLVTMLTYGVLITRLGFYRDDWYLLSTGQSQGSAGIVALFQIDRPLLGYLYALAFRVLGMAPLAWQLAALLMRLIGNLAFFWLLNNLWPERRAEALAIALLFSVYPGFTVQPNAGVYISDLTASAAALVSFVLMLAAMQASRLWIRILASVLAASLELFYLGIFESAVGLEAARLVLLWYVLWRRDGGTFKQSLVRALRWDIPYLILAGGFVVWRLFIFQSTRRATNLNVLIGRYTALPVRSAFSVLIETVKDIIETAVFAWVVPFYQFVAKSNYRDLGLSVLLAALVAGLVLLFFRGALGIDRAAEKGRHPYRHLHAIPLGALIVLFGLLPIDLAGRNVLFSDQWDRYTLYASSGVALLVGGFIFQFFRDTARTTILLVLVSMSVVVHYFSAAAYRDAWSWQRDLWHQMVWRAPVLRSDTMLFVVLPAAGYAEGYEIYGPANMIYGPGRGVQIGGDVVNSATAANLQLGKNRQHYDRSVLVPDNYGHALIATYPQDRSCLHVLDGRKIEMPGFMDDSLVADVAPYSRIDQIDATATPSPLPSFLEGEQPPAWCFYYEKMDLERQSGNWTEVARLADEALGKGLAPEDVSELMPVLEAYATLGRTQDARHAASIIRSEDSARAFLCVQLQRGAAYPSPYDYNEVNDLLCQAN